MARRSPDGNPDCPDDDPECDVGAVDEINERYLYQSSILPSDIMKSGYQFFSGFLCI